MKDAIIIRISPLLWTALEPWQRLRRQEGQTLPEYALIIALVAVALLVAVAFMQDKIGSLFSKVGHSF
jgi:Flp pilus assembly pilin Flp